MAALIPSLLLLLFGAWCGTFWGAATFWGSTVGAAAVLAMAAASSWPDPLRLGRWGWLLPPGLWIAVAVSAWRSPVPRASWMALVLLPAFLMVPGAVARLWRTVEARRLGLRGVAIVASAVSLWALIDWWVRDLPRVAMPLGHHNLLATWLVILLPLTLLAAREAGLWRWVGLAGGFLAVVTILATRSLAGNLALAVEALLALAWIVRSRRGRLRVLWVLVPLALAALAGLILQRERIASIVAGQDLSLQGRAVYYEGALEGFRARPVFGWGPGSAAWTAAAFFDPVPGVSFWGESVGELHSLPLHLAYEVGAVGSLLALLLAVVFFARRISELRRSDDPAVVLAGLLGLCGAAVAGLGSAALAVTALPLAAAVAAGAALSDSGSKGPRLPIVLYACLAALALIPTEAARWFYDRAVAGEAPVRSLERAVRLDPRFPLYGMRLALLREPQDAGLALRAAREGRSVATLWTVAGILASDSKQPWAAGALDRACALDPLNAFPPFFLMTLDPEGPDAARHGAHALLADPRLAAAVFWEGRPELLARVGEEVRRWPGVDPGWKEAFLAALPAPGERRGPAGRIELEIDAEPDLALSLHTFRRRPFAARWPLVRVRMAPLERLGLPPATTLRGTPKESFTAACRPPERSTSGQRVLRR